MNYLTVPLHTSHKKKDFNCGKKLLDDYLHTQAKQDVKRKLAACFVLPDENNKIKGYFTLSSTSINRNFLTEAVLKKLPPAYYHLPATLLGRLAIDNSYKGQGLGELLLVEALRKSYEISQEIGSMAVIVDPIDDEAVKFYEKYGFIILKDSGKMFMAMWTIGELFG